MSDLVTLQDGGMAVVVMGSEFEVPKLFATHPQLCVLPVATLPETVPAMASAFPPNARLVLVGGELPRLAFDLVRRAAERRQLPLQVRRNEPALRDILGKVLAKSAAPVPNGQAADAPATETEGRRRGAVTAFVAAHVDLSKGAAEEARRLLVIAQQQGLSTTFGSLSQAVSNAKRKAGATGVPKSATPEHINALNTLADAIAGLQLMVPFIETVVKENADLRAQIEAAHARRKKVRELLEE